jgi:F-type H+-transporting ATPase subunit b
MQIDWWTLALQAVNFLVLVWLLRRFLYRPVKDVIEKRKQLAEQAFADAAAKQQDADTEKQGLRQDRAQLAQERQDLLKQLHESMEAERMTVMEQARKDADQLLADARNAIEVERTVALAALRGQVADLATDMATGLLAKAGAGVPAEAFIDRLSEQLQALPADEHDRLKKDLAAEGGVVTVVTAAALEPADRERWSERLNGALGCPCKAEFQTDPAIVGGAELRFPHAVLTFTYADLLAKARDLVVKNDVDS